MDLRELIDRGVHALVAGLELQGEVVLVTAEIVLGPTFYAL